MAAVVWKACCVTATASAAGSSRRAVNRQAPQYVCQVAEPWSSLAFVSSSFAAGQLSPLHLVSSHLHSTSQVKAGRGVVQVVCEQAVEELPPKLHAIVKGFQAVPEPRARYQQLLHYAAKLKPLPKEYHTLENKVVGCVSQVWILPSLAEDGTVHFQADSDSALTKGLAALLVEGLGGSPPSAILKVTPDFIQMLGLKQSLTPSRNNGFLNMLKLMQKKTLELYVQSEAAKKVSGSTQTAAEESSEEERSADGASGRVPAGNGAASGNGAAKGADAAAGVASTSGRPMYDAIKRKLSEGLATSEVEVEDVSHEHAGHAGVHRGATETHFNVKVVSSKFEGLSTVKRHRAVYTLLSEELSNGLHALSLVTKSPAEMQRV